MNNHFIKITRRASWASWEDWACFNRTQDDKALTLEKKEEISHLRKSLKFMYLLKGLDINYGHHPNHLINMIT